MTERRIKPRRKTAEYHIVYDRQNNDVIGRVLNLTPEGARLICAEPVEIGVQAQCRMRLPDIINGVREIRFDMVSRWCEFNKVGDWYETGWVFVQLNDLAQSAIEQMIENWPSEPIQRRIHPTGF